MDKEKNKLYSHPRWTEIPLASPTGRMVEFTKEEEEHYRKILKEFIKRDQERLKQCRKDAEN